MLPNHFTKFCDGANIGNMGEHYMKEFQDTYQEVISRQSSESKQEALQEEIVHCLSISRCKTDVDYKCSKFLLKSYRAVEILTDFLKGLPVYKEAENIIIVWTLIM
jgi:hypothetical protein